ncbi:hypothetical protein, partial [Alistipes ihumii]|uniref:hypothetical protein n=1 Tax=Alistipes ihumii TaxID=1470347 RepID=UPI00307AF242
GSDSGSLPFAAVRQEKTAMAAHNILFRIVIVLRSSGWIGVLLALAYKVESEKKQHGKYSDSVRNICSADSCFSSRRFFCLS